VEGVVPSLWPLGLRRVAFSLSRIPSLPLRATRRLPSPAPCAAAALPIPCPERHKRLTHPAFPRTLQAPHHPARAPFTLAARATHFAAQFRANIQIHTLSRCAGVLGQPGAISVKAPGAAPFPQSTPDQRLQRSHWLEQPSTLSPGDNGSSIRPSARDTRRHQISDLHTLFAIWTPAACPLSSLHPWLPRPKASSRPQPQPLT